MGEPDHQGARRRGMYDAPVPKPLRIKGAFPRSHREQQIGFESDVCNFIGDQSAAQSLQLSAPGSRLERTVVDLAYQFCRDEHGELQFQSGQTARAAKNAVGPVSALSRKPC